MGVLDVLRLVEEVCVYVYIYMVGSEGPWVRQLHENEAYKRWEVVVVMVEGVEKV